MYNIVIKIQHQPDSGGVFCLFRFLSSCKWVSVKDYYTKSNLDGSAFERRNDGLFLIIRVWLELWFWAMWKLNLCKVVGERINVHILLRYLPRVDMKGSVFQQNMKDEMHTW